MNRHESIHPVPANGSAPHHTEDRSGVTRPRDRRRPIDVVLVNDYELVIHGLAAMLAPYADRVRVVDTEVGGTPNTRADVALFDTFAGRKYALKRAAQMVDEGHVDHVVLYTWDASAEFLTDAERTGVHGVILKSRSGRELVEALERVAAGEQIGLDHVTRSRRGGRDHELSTREQEVLALVALGLTNRDIANELYLSVDTVKTYVRRLFTKLGVSNRTQAATRASDFDLQPPAARFERK